MPGEAQGVGTPEVLPLHTDADVVRARKRVREAAISIGLDLVAQTKVVTATSELARNTVIHGKGGELTIEELGDNRGSRRGLHLLFADEGPGIADLGKAMTGGWSSGTGLGLGLPGSRRLVHEFDIDTTPGVGTRIGIVVWARS